MATDIQAETREAYEIHESRATGDVPEAPAFVLGEPASPSRWWTRGALIVVAIVVVTAVGVYISAASSRTDSGPQLTHAIARRDVVVSVTEQGTLESSDNTEIKCKVRGSNTVLWVIDAGTEVTPGDELVKLDTSTIEDNINQQKILYQRALATHTQSEADAAVAKIAITEYIEGTYRAALKTLEKDLAIGEANLRAAKTILDHSRRMFKRGYVSELEVERNEFTLDQSNLELELKKTEIDVLKRFTKAKEMETLESALKAAEAKLASDKASLDLEKARLDREEQQLENCVIRADASGMVIYPSAAQWKETPDIEEGATVREDQLLLMIPDLTKMQVKVGIHESKVERIKKGLSAVIRLQDETIDGKVASVASVTRPAGWWTGNVVKYDTIVELDTRKGLKPGMSAEVEIIMARHENVVAVPVAAVVEHEKKFSCWVKDGDEFERRFLELGDTNDQFIVVEAGLTEGDEVVLNPLAFIDDAQREAMKPLGESTDESKGKASADAGDAEQPGEGETSPDDGAETASDKSSDAKDQTDKKPKISGEQLIELADKNGDGVLTIDEFAEKDRSHFADTDANGDGKVDAAEAQAGIERLLDAKKP